MAYVPVTNAEEIARNFGSEFSETHGDVNVWFDATQQKNILFCKAAR